MHPDSERNRARAALRQALAAAPSVTAWLRVAMKEQVHFRLITSEIRTATRKECEHLDAKFCLVQHRNIEFCDSAENLLMSATAIVALHRLKVGQLVKLMNPHRPLGDVVAAPDVQRTLVNEVNEPSDGRVLQQTVVLSAGRTKLALITESYGEAILAYVTA